MSCGFRPSFPLIPSWGNGMVGAEGWEWTRWAHSPMSVPPPGCDHRTREPSLSPPLHSRVVPKHHPNPRALPEHPQSTAGPQPPVPIHTLGGFAPLHPDCSRSTAPEPPVTVGFACWEPLALLQGPLANVNAFFSLESSLDDLPEQISHASPKIMPFAFPALEKKRSPLCRQCVENGCMGPHVSGVRAEPTGGLPAAPRLHTAPVAHCIPLHPLAKISLHPGIPSIPSHPLYIPCISASPVSPHISSHPPASLHPTASSPYPLHPCTARTSPHHHYILCIPLHLHISSHPSVSLHLQRSLYPLTLSRIAPHSLCPPTPPCIPRISSHPPTSPRISPCPWFPPHLWQPHGYLQCRILAPVVICPLSRLGLISAPPRCVLQSPPPASGDTQGLPFPTYSFWEMQWGDAAPALPSLHSAATHEHHYGCSWS